MNTLADVDGAGGLADLAAARRDLYRFLSAAFLTPPQPQWLASLQDPAFQAALAEWFSPAVVEALRQVAEARRAPGFADAVRQEFNNLFLVPGDQYVAPYESVFRDRREIDGREVSGLLMGQSALDVQQWYRLAALEISSDFKDLPDHLGLYFHYLAFLCEKEQQFEQAGDAAKLTRAREMQRDFLKAHVLSWLEALAEKLRAKARLPLYPAITSLAVEFCQNDLATLESALGPSSGHPVPAYAT